MSKAKKSKEKVNTSTPARAFGGDKIIYGFDLSPVHSHEMPGATLSGRVSVFVDIKTYWCFLHWYNVHSFDC